MTENHNKPLTEEEEEVVRRIVREEIELLLGIRDEEDAKRNRMMLEGLREFIRNPKPVE